MRKAMLLLAVIGLAGSLWAADLIVGTWKLNVAKSKFSKAGPKEWTDIYREIDGDKIEVSVKIIMSDGSSSIEKIIFPRQGGASTFLQGGSGRQEFATLIAPNEWLVTGIENGKQTSAMHQVISKDGKTMRYIIKGTGSPFEGEAVFDKQ